MIRVLLTLAATAVLAIGVTGCTYNHYGSRHHHGHEHHWDHGYGGGYGDRCDW